MSCKPCQRGRRVGGDDPSYIDERSCGGEGNLRVQLRGWKLRERQKKRWPSLGGKGIGKGSQSHR